jgi:hypothetical protein
VLVLESVAVRALRAPSRRRVAILVFTHRGLSARNGGGFGAGSHAFLDRLDAHLGGRQIPGRSERYEQLAPAYTAPT